MRCAPRGAARADPVAAGRGFECDTCPNEFRFVRRSVGDHLYLRPRPSVADLGVICPADDYAFRSGGNPRFAAERSDQLTSASAWTISLHNGLLDHGWPAPVVRSFRHQNPLPLGLFVALDWTRARLGLGTSSQRLIARRGGG